MKKVLFVTLAVFFCFSTVTVFGGDNGLDSFITSLNVKAEADLGAFKAKLSVHFGVPAPEVETLVRTVDTPADAYMCLRVAQIAKQPTEVVVMEYKAHKGKGWGVIAKNLGIKPGSKEFHELKKGIFEGQQGTGHGKGKGHNK